MTESTNDDGASHAGDFRRPKITPKYVSDETVPGSVNRGSTSEPKEEKGAVDTHDTVEDIQPEIQDTVVQKPGVDEEFMPTPDSDLLSSSLESKEEQVLGILPTKASDALLEAEEPKSVVTEESNNPNSSSTVDKVDPKPAREGDTGVGRKLVTVKQEQAKGSGGNVYKKPATQEPVYSKTDIWAPALLRSTAFMTSLVVVILTFVFILMSNYLGLLLQIAALNISWLSWTLGGFILSLSAVVLYFIAKFMLSYFRLRNVPQIVVHQVNSDFEDIEKLTDARIRFIEHLMILIRAEEKWSEKLSKCGVTDEQYFNLKAAASKLTKDRPISADSWWRECDECFLKPIDEIAQKLSKEAAKNVGLKTAISPWRAMDTFAVAYHSMSLVHKLALLANFRTGRMASLGILSHVTFNTYVASQTQLWSEKAVDVAKEMRTELYQEVGTDLGGSVLTDALKKVTAFVIPKIAEGMTNSLFVYRLGSRSWRLLRPVKKI